MKKISKLLYWIALIAVLISGLCLPVVTYASEMTVDAGVEFEVKPSVEKEVTEKKFFSLPKTGEVKSVGSWVGLLLVGAISISFIKSNRKRRS